jgi:hypothetical protein
MESMWKRTKNRAVTGRKRYPNPRTSAAHPTREMRIQEPEFRRRRALRAVPDSDFWIVGSQKFMVG